MSNRICVATLVLTGVIAVGHGTAAQPDATAEPAGAAVAAALAGGVAPLTLVLKDLGPSWRRFTPGTETSASNATNLFTAMMTGQSTAYYTQGKTVALGSTLYLIAYSTPHKDLDFAALQKLESMPKPEPLTPDSPLELTLFNLSTMSSIGGIRPFDLATETAPPKGSGLADVFEGARDRAQASSSSSNLKQLGVALRMYCDDYDGVYPPMANEAQMKKAVMPYVKSEEAFKVPGKEITYRPNPWLSKKKEAAVKQPAAIVALFEPEPGEDGLVGLLFADGHVKRVSPAEAASVKKASHIP